MIPKVIHYCWFGGNPFPEIVKECMDSWTKHCPDYQIIEWNESNFDVFSCPYTKQAYEAKMWAFVSDYARIKILYEKGGIYMDTDVELLKNLDPLLKNKAFMGFEAQLAVNSGLIAGSIAKLPIIGELVNEYHDFEFTRKDGSYNLTPCVEYQTNLLEKYGLLKENRIQVVEDLKIYPIEYFSPFNHITGSLNVKEETYSIHKFEGLWAPETGRHGTKLKWKYMNKYGVFWGKIFRLFPYFVYIIRNDGVKGLLSKIRKKFNI
jgi:hypothetical protein